MTTREKMLEQALSELTESAERAQLDLNTCLMDTEIANAKDALAIPADDDVGGARTAEVPGTGACICAGAGTCLYCIAVRVLNEHLGSAGVALLTGHTALSNAAPMTNARTSDNNGEARDAEVDRTLPWIVCAAMRYPDGSIVVGPRHGDHVMRWQIGDDRRPQHSKVEQGFIDQRGNFYSRTDAWKVAERNGQIRARCGGDESNGGTLYSENLY